MQRPTLALARRDPQQWRRHGLTPPHELEAMIATRLQSLPAEPRYADFFAERS
jgi:hypothetical protein